MNFDHCYVDIPAPMRKRKLPVPVYRVISLKRLYELFEKRVNTLVKSLAWQDPFENSILALKGRLSSGEIVEFAQRYDFLGQCWTLVEASDAMWRIYSKDKRSVCIKVELRTLVETLASTAKGLVFIGKVRYLSTNDLLNWAKRVIRDADTPDVRLLVRTLLVKRTAFSHEREVRLLYFDPLEEHPWLFQYGVDPHSFVKQIVVDPRLSDAQASKIMKEIRIRTGFRGPIVHSDLYAAPREFVLRLGEAYSSLPRQSKRVTYEGKMRKATINFTLPGTQIVLPAPDPRFEVSTQRMPSRRNKAS